MTRTDAGNSRGVRAMYTGLGLWILLMVAAVAYLQLGDPTSGHAGRLVFPDERTLEDTNASPRGTFRIAKEDRVEKMTAVPVRTAANAWIRITAGPHRGRMGVVVW